MTENNPEGVTPDTFDLMDWIESGTVARRQVVIHNNPALLEEYQALEAQLAAADKAAADSAGDGPMSEADPRPEILEAMRALYERWEASKATWTVRALSRDDVMATFDPEQGGVAHPKTPVPPLEKAGRKAQEDFMGKVATYQKDVATADAERRLHQLAAAVVSIETTRGTATGATVAQLRALRDRPHGSQWLDKLWSAVEAATEGDVEIPRPTSREGSTSTQA